MIDMIHRSDGRTLYPCGARAYPPPTNPKAGTPTSGNTLIWNERNRQTTLVVPRQNPVNIDSWLPQSSTRSRFTPSTYQKPQALRAAAESAAASRRTPLSPSCPSVLPNGQTLCGK